MSRSPTKPERALYEMAEEYSRRKSNGGFTSSDDMEAARRSLRRAARAFVESEDESTTGLDELEDQRREPGAQYAIPTSSFVASKEELKPEPCPGHSRKDCIQCDWKGGRPGELVR